MLRRKGTPCARTREATILVGEGISKYSLAVAPSTYFPSSAATYKDIIVLNTRRLECMNSNRASFERMLGITIRRIPDSLW